MNENRPVTLKLKESHPVPHWLPDKIGIYVDDQGKEYKVLRSSKDLPATLDVPADLLEYDLLFMADLWTGQVYKEQFTGILYKKIKYRGRSVLRLQIPIFTEPLQYLIIPPLDSVQEEEAYALKVLYDTPPVRFKESICPLCQSRLFVDKNNPRIAICPKIACMSGPKELEVINRFVPDGATLTEKDFDVYIEDTIWNDKRLHSLCHHMFHLLDDYIHEGRGKVSPSLIDFVDEMANMTVSVLLGIPSFHSLFTETERHAIFARWTDDTAKMIACHNAGEIKRSTLLSTSFWERFEYFLDVNKETLSWWVMLHGVVRYPPP